jgi:hypothetical protein
MQPRTTRCTATLVFVLLYGPVAVAQQAPRVAQDQHITVVFALWTPGPAPLLIEDFPVQNVLTPEDGYLLRLSLPGGNVVTWKSSSMKPAAYPKRA